MIYLLFFSSLFSFSFVDLYFVYSVYDVPNSYEVIFSEFWCWFNMKLCGPVKSWKRAQDPTDGTPRGFGFCEFESAEGVLRALRLLSKLNVDGQELVVWLNSHIFSFRSFITFYSKLSHFTVELMNVRPLAIN